MSVQKADASLEESTTHSRQTNNLFRVWDSCPAEEF